MERVKNNIRQIYHRWSLQQFLAELLQKRWMEAVIPFTIMILLLPFFALQIPNYLSVGNLLSMSGEFAEFNFVVLGMALVIISGGIDLSVGSMFAMTNLIALLLYLMLEWPPWAVIPAVLATGAMMGACNGVLIGFLKTRAFLTTLVTMIIFRSFVVLLNQRYSIDIAMGYNESEFWDFLGDGTVGAVPFNILFFLLIAAIAHFMLSRSRPGWHLIAIGASRKTARHTGIAVERNLFLTYVLSGIFSATGGLLYAARLGSSASDTGNNLEVTVLTAVVLGGVSLGGGRGSIGRALIGSTIVMLLTNGLVRLGVAGPMTSLLFGGILLLAVGLDVKWLKNRHKVIQKIYVVPTFLKLPSMRGQKDHSTNESSNLRMFQEYTPIENPELIGLGQIDGPEDIILDRQGRLYGAVRQGWIVRFSGEDFSEYEIFANIGGRPLGMAFDRDDNLIVCVGGMGVYGVRPDGEVYKLTDQTNRTWWKLNDDSRLRLADDLDIAPDGKVYFSEATIRYEMHSWAIDSLEGRGNGRIICYDPVTNKTQTILRNLIFPNGICVTHDGESILFAETWACRISRYWIAGPKKGKQEILIPNLPGYPDNINRASDGSYWVALVGMRTPSYDLAMQNPSFRTRMVKRIPPDEWLYPNINAGCVIKFNEAGDTIETLWDRESTNHATITSMREHKGYLYLGGIFNNRIGRIKLKTADNDWIGPESYWGKAV